MKQIIGIDLSVLDKTADIGPSTHVQPECPGAFIRATMADYQSFQRAGVKFVGDDSHIPGDGTYGDARVKCPNLVQRLVEKRKGPDGIPYESIPVRYYGLCVHCSSMERVNRDTLRKRLEAKDEKRSFGGAK